MTNTSVKDVGSLLSGVSGSLQPAGTQMNVSSGKDSFDAVFRKQTDSFGQQDRQEDFNVEKKSPGVKVSKSTQKQEKLNGSEKTEKIDRSENVKDIDDLTEEEIAEKASGMNEVVMQLLQDIADSFGVSTEELQSKMDELGLQTMDLLDSDALGKLVLAMGNAEDSLSLLTNEGLYDNFQRIMSEREEFVSQLCDRMQMTPGEIEEVLTKIKEMGQAADAVELSDDYADNMANRSETENNENAFGIAQANEEVLGASDNANLDTTGNGASQRRQSRQETSENSEISPNLVLEQTLEDGSKVTTEFTMAEAAETRTDTENIMRQIMDYMKVQIKPDMSQMEMQLHPASLGTLQVQVASKNGVLTAQFITQSESVRAALEGQMIQLKENFEQQGVKVEAIEVSVQTQQFDRNLQQEQGRGQESSPQKGRTRRIRLDGTLTDSALEEMGEEERLATKVMEANGNTVDFMA